MCVRFFIIVFQCRHTNSGVRSAAAQVLGSLSVVTPIIASDFLSSALLNTQNQVKQLLQFDPSDFAAAAAEDENGGSGSFKTEAEQQQALVAARRRSSKEQERMQRLFFFHGHTLVTSILLKSANNVPTGLPHLLVEDFYSLGLALLQQDVFAAPPAVRNVVCSVVRAGSLIVSSCVSMGYATAKIFLPQLLRACVNVFRQASGGTLAHSSSNNNLPAAAVSSNSSSAAASGTGGSKSEDLTFEVMCVEAALVCLSNLLHFCPEALVVPLPEFAAAASSASQLLSDSSSNSGKNSPVPAESAAAASTEDITPTCLSVIIEGLELAYKATRSKYQPRMRTIFRFKCLHAALLECYCLLPQGSFPSSSQAAFFEVRIGCSFLLI
jgi:hypothetical protein